MTVRATTLFFFLIIGLSGHLTAQTNPKLAIVKADDLRKVTDNWNRFVEVSSEREVKVSIGIICESLQDEDQEYIAWIKNHHESGSVEFWNHGWNHKRWTTPEGVNLSEFKGSGYDHQKKHFDDAQAIMQRILGTAPIAFGSPFNALDQETLKILNDTPESQLYFCNKVLSDCIKTPAPMIFRGESDGTGKPNFESFETDYRKKPDTRFSVIQFHPNNFGEEQFSEYIKIIEFLKNEGWTFILPAEYTQSIKQNHE